MFSDVTPYDENKDIPFCGECNVGIVIGENDVYTFCCNCLEIFCSDCAYDRDSGGYCRCPRCRDELVYSSDIDYINDVKELLGGDYDRA